MAKYQLTGPDGATYEVNAPGDMPEADVLARFQSEVGKAKGAEPYEISESARGARRFRHALGLGVGAADIPADALVAGMRTLAGTGDPEGFGAEYRRQRATTKKAIEPSLAPTDLVTDTAGQTVQAVATAPLAMARNVSELGVSGLQAAQSQLSRLLAPRGQQVAVREGTAVLPELAQTAGAELTRKQIAKESTKVGAAYGSAGAAGEDYASVPEALAGTATHTAGGAVLGRLIPAGINLVSDYVVGPVRNVLAARKTARAERAAGVVRDFEEAGIGEPPPYTMGGPAVQGVASGLEGTLFGSSIREPAARSIAALEQRIAQEIEAAGGTATPAEVGARVQEFLRKNLVERSKDPAVVQAMTPQELHEISGIAPHADYNPAPPKIAPVRPALVEPVTPDAYLQGVAKAVPEVRPRAVTSVEGKYKEPTVNDVELHPDLVKKVQDSSKSVADLQRRVLAEQETIAATEQPFQEEMGRLGINGAYQSPESGIFVFTRAKGPAIQILPDGRGLGIPTPQEKEFIARAIPFLENQRSNLYRGLKKSQEAFEAAKIERDIVQRETEAYRVEQLPVLAEQRRTQAMTAAEAEAGSEAAVATQRAREEAVTRERPTALQGAMKRNEQLKAEAAAKAEAETAARQQQADQQFLTDLEARKARADEPFQLGKSGESYLTELDAAYEAAGHNAPPVQRNPLGQRGGEVTNVSKLLDQFALEARRRGSQTGYKEGQHFTEQGALQEELLGYLKPRLGDDVAKLFAYLSERRAKSQFTPGMQGLQDMRTAVGRKLREFEQKPIPGAAPRQEDEAMLARLYKAIDQDIDAFAKGAGPRGDLYRQQREQIDQAYEQYVNDIRKPLSKVFGDNVDSVSALSMLVKDTQKGGNVDRLAAFYKVVGDKGDRLAGTGWLLGDMARGGVEGFLQAYRALTPDARNLMFQGPARELGHRLDALARAGGHLERYAKNAGGEFKVDLRPSNVGLGLLGYASFPAMVKMALGAEGMARLVSSKWFGGWLKAFPVEKGPASPEWASHMNRFRALATETLGANEGVVDALASLAPTKAKAGPAGPAIAGRKPEESSTGSGWMDQLMENEPRTQGLRNENGFNSWWMPRTPDFKSRDHNSFDPLVPEGYGLPNPTQGDKGFRQKITFGGEGSKTADKAALADAKGMRESKAPPADIFRKTGWFFDDDGVWRNEIDDSKAEVKRPDFGSKKSIKVKVGEVLDHPDLFAAYPWLEKFPIELVNKEFLDKKSKMRGETEMPQPGKGVVGWSRVATARSDKELIELVLHEIQHAIDPHEGADYGPADPESYDTRIGEVRARNVEERRGMSAKERREKHPMDTQPVPPEDVELSPERKRALNAVGRRVGR